MSAARRRVIAVAFASLVVVTAVWWLAHVRLTALRSGLVSRANALAALKFERPTHITGDEDPETFVESLADAYGPVAEAAAEWAPRDQEPIFDRCAEVRDGVRAIDDLPDVCADLVTTHGDAVRRLLDATHRRSLGDHRRLRGMKLWPLLTAVSLAGLDARLALDGRGDPAAALETCIDLLALWRDLVQTPDLFTRTSASEIVQRSFAICRDAIARAPAASMPRAAEQLAAITTALPAADLAVRAESTRLELTLFGHELGAAGRSVSSAAPEHVTESGRFDGDDDATPAWIAPWLVPPPWRAYLDISEVIGGAALMAPAPGFETIAAALADPALPELARAGASTRWDRHLTLDAVARGRVLLLWAATRARAHRLRVGVWPESLDAIGPPPVAVPGARLRLHVTTSEDGPASVTGTWSIARGMSVTRQDIVELPAPTTVALPHAAQ